MAYEVTCIHHKECWRNGDREAEDVIDSTEVFPTKKEVLKYLQRQVVKAWNGRYECSFNSNIRNTLPSLTVFTRVTWIHENTGNTEEEYYWYKTRKL